MFPKTDPTTTAAWNRLADEHKVLRKTNLKDMFVEDADRFSKFSIYAPDILVDFSKNLIADTTLLYLYELASNVAFLLQLKLCSMVIRSMKQRTDLCCMLH